MRPEILDSSGTPIASLTNIEDDTARLKEVVNGEYTFSFQALEKNLTSEYFVETNMIKVWDQYFDIFDIRRVHDNKLYNKIETEHVTYRLNDYELDTYANTGTPAAILTDILSGTDFSVGTVEFTESITVSFNQKTNKRTMVKDLAKTLGGELNYTNNGFTINILNEIGVSRGGKLKFGTNILSIARSWNRKDGITGYKVKAAVLKGTNQYIDAGLQDLEVYGLGDSVDIEDIQAGIDTTQRILSIVSNPVTEETVDIEFVTEIKMITDRIYEVATNSVIKDEVYNEVSISPDYGFRSELSNKLARASYGAGSLVMEKGDGAGNYDIANGGVGWDALNGRFKYVGEVVVEAISGLDADDVDESASRKWAAESGADITGNNTAFDSLNLDGVPSTVFSGWKATGKTTIDGGNIETDTVTTIQLAALSVTTDELAANAVTAPKIQVNELSAISADLGIVNAGEVNSIDMYSSFISGTTMVGGTVKTSSSGERLEMSGDDLKAYNASNQLHGFQMQSGNSYTQLPIYNDGTLIGNIAMTDQNGFQINTFTDATNGNIIVNASDVISLVATEVLYNGVEVATVNDIPSGDITAVYAGHGLDGGGTSGAVTLDVDETELDFGNESRSWFESSMITRPYYGTSNYCYVDTNGVDVVFRDSNGDTVITI